MEQDNGWTVTKYTKTVLVVGTPLYLMWTDEDQKLHPKCTFEGNVRIAITQYIANGFIFMVFKDNSVRKIHMCDEAKVITVSNNIVASRQVGHTRAKATAAKEPLCAAFDPNAGNSDDEDEEDYGEEDESESQDEGEGDDTNLPNDDVRLQTILGLQYKTPGKNQETTPAEHGNNGEGMPGNDRHDRDGDGGTASTSNTGSYVVTKLAEEPALEDKNGDGLASNAKEPAGEDERRDGVPGHEVHDRNGAEGVISTLGSDLAKPSADVPAKEPVEEDQNVDVVAGNAKEPAVEDEIGDEVPGNEGNHPNGDEGTTSSFLFQGLSNGPYPPRPSLPESMRELREMEILLKSKKKFISALKREKADPDNKRTAQKMLEEQLKALKSQVKKEKEAFKQEKKTMAPAKRRRAEDNEDENNAGSEDLDLFKATGKRVLTTIDKWQKGHRRAALCAARNKLVEKVTCDSWEQGYQNMCEYGFAVVNHWPDLVHPACRPNAEQRDYIHTLPEDCKETIFEGAKFSDISTFVDAHYDRVTDIARCQMKQVQSGAQAAKWKAYKECYGMQMNQIIEGFTVFEEAEPIMAQADKPKSGRGSKKKQTHPGDKNTHIENFQRVLRTSPGMFSGAAGYAANWKFGMTTVMNGSGYQHPHADAGRPESYKGMKIFPFVTIHGFGVDYFSMWLLPDPFSNANKYGFLHTFEPHQILLMRGDFVHAGVPSQIPRGHMKFFPNAEAGWNQENAFWQRKGWEQTSFLWQGSHPPFGYPHVGTPDLSGFQIVHYPVAYTKMLRFPYTRDECAILGVPYDEPTAEEKARRTALKKKAVAQLGLCVFNV